MNERDSTIWIWKDARDPDMISLGSRRVSRHTGNAMFTSWCQCHVDAIDDWLGEEMARRVRAMPSGCDLRLVLSVRED